MGLNLAFSLLINKWFLARDARGAERLLPGWSAHDDHVVYQHGVQDVQLRQFLPGGDPPYFSNTIFRLVVKRLSLAVEVATRRAM